MISIKFYNIGIAAKTWLCLFLLTTLQLLAVTAAKQKLLNLN